MDIGVFKRVLNSVELECFEFLVGVRQVNSWDELGVLLIDVFNTEADVSSGVEYMQSVEYGDFVKVFNSLMIKYLSYDGSVVYSFDLPYDKTFRTILNGYDDYIIEFKKRMVDFAYDYEEPRILTNNLGNCVILDIDRGIGLIDFGIKLYNKEDIYMKFINVDLDSLKLNKFVYRDKSYSYGITMLFRGGTWQDYMGTYETNMRIKQRGNNSFYSGLIQICTDNNLSF